MVENKIRQVLKQGLCKSGSWIWNIKDNTVNYSDEWKISLGFEREELSNNISEWIERIHPKDRFESLKILTGLNKNGKTHFDFYYRIKTKSGVYCWMNCYGTALEFDENDKASLLWGIQQDVDDLKTSEEYYRRINLGLEKLSENFGGGILFESEDRKILYINQLFCDYFNIPVPPEHLLGTDCTDAAENSKELFADPASFVENIKLILKYRVPVYREVCKLKNGRILERDYIPVFEKELYRGHLWLYRDITRFKESEDRLQYRLKFEELITELSAKFINLALKDIDKAIDETLGVIGKFIKADRSYVFLYSNNFSVMNNTNEWVGEGITPEKDNLQNIPADTLPWWNQKIQNKEIINIPSVAQLPEEASAEKAILEPQHIKSLIVVPTIYKKTSIGFIGFDAVKDFTVWTYDSVKLLTMVASVITNAIKRRENEEALSKSEAQYRLVVNNIKEVIFQTDIKGNWTFLNPAWQNIMGYSIDESIGNNFSIYIHPTEKEKNFDILRPLVSGDMEFSLHDVIFLTKDGKEKICEVFAKSAVDEYGNITGTNGTIRDMTHQREVEKRIKKLNRAIETTAAGVLLADFNGTVTYANPGFLSLCKCNSVDQVTGKSILSLTTAECAKKLDEAIQKDLREGKTWKGEIELKRRIGKNISVEMICSAVMDDNDNPLYIVSNIYDITERKKAEAEIKKSFEREKELSELKTKFISMVSHEFRTPLASILSSSELIEQYYDKLTPDKKDALMGKIKTSVKNLIAMLADITEINKADSGKVKLNLEEIDVVKLIYDLIDEVKQSYSPSPVVRYTPAMDSLVIVSDMKLLRQIFINLISNAVKYTDAEKHVYISIHQNPDLLIFQVEDEGIGIPEDDFATLFEPFMRSRNTGKIKGTGLGLSILKRAVEQLGGKVDFKSIVGSGSTFTVYLPFHNNQSKELEWN